MAVGQNAVWSRGTPSAPLRLSIVCGAIMRSRQIAGVAIVIGTAVLSLCLWAGWGLLKSDFAVVPGPETFGLADHVPGHVVWGEPRGVIVGLSFPERKAMNIRLSSGEGSVHSVDGPDCGGRIVFVERIAKQHFLKWIPFSGGEEETIFSRPGDTIWDHVIGESLALAWSGGRVAFVSNLDDVQMLDPPTLIRVGCLETWDVERKARLHTNVKAINVDTRPPYRGLSWFPDGKRIAYVELVSKNQTTLPDARLAVVDVRFRTWDKVPAVHILDTDSGQKTFLRVGWSAVVSSDGKTVLVHDFGQHWTLVDVATGECKRADWPGRVHGGVIAFLDSKWVVYWGLPTAGSPIRYTSNNSPIVGKKVMLTVKVAEINTDRFQTIVPYLDPRSAVSFGPP